MIFTIRKNIYKHKVDTLIKNALGDSVCIIKAFDGGYLVFNNDLLQIADVIFEKHLVTIKIAQTKEIITIKPFTANQVLDGDILINIMGNYHEYNYDGFIGSKLYFQTVKNSLNEEYFQLKVNDGNALKFILISLALEKISNDSLCKLK